MKKATLLLTAVLLLLAFAGCTAKPQPQTTTSSEITTTTAEATTTAPASEETTTTQDTEPVTEPEPETTPVQTAESEVFGITFSGIRLIPGSLYPIDSLPVEDSRYTVPSCAFEGNDTVYSFTDFEVTTYTSQDDGLEYIYSIYFVEPNILTDEGVGLGDDSVLMEEKYGTDFVESTGECIYTKGSTLLSFILQDDQIVAIEYRLEVTN